MTLPGVNVLSRESPPASSVEIDTGTWFVAGFSERGPTDEAVLVRNLSQFTDTFGDRVAYGVLYDALDVFFREGGSRANVGRVAGPAATVATANLSDGTGNTMRVDAISPGAWGANIDLVVTHPSGSTFKIEVQYNGVPVESSPELADKAAALAWVAGSNWIKLTDLGTGSDPTAATTSLAGGDDDHAAATDASWKAALDLFTKDKGPGQVSMPGRTAAQGYADQLAHAKSNNRVAIMDLVDDPLAANLVDDAAPLRASADARYGGVFAPWAVVPGLALGTTRVVPYSAVQAGLIARLEGTGATPNEAAAGVNGISTYSVGLSQPAWSDSDKEDLNNAGVNVARFMNGGVRTYGYRTLVDPLTNPTWLMLTNSRLYMLIAALSDEIGERFVFEQIDGKRKAIGKFNGELVGALVPLYEAGALFGATFAEAATVETGDQVNTPETINNREIRAVVSVAMSPFGEVVTIEIVKVTNTEA